MRFLNEFSEIIFLYEIYFALLLIATVIVRAQWWHKVVSIMTFNYVWKLNYNLRVF